MAGAIGAAVAGLLCLSPWRDGLDSLDLLERISGGNSVQDGHVTTLIDEIGLSLAEGQLLQVCLLLMDVFLCSLRCDLPASLLQQLQHGLLALHSFSFLRLNVSLSIVDHAF